MILVELAIKMLMTESLLVDHHYIDRHFQVFPSQQSCVPIV